ncbi:protein G12-like [Andrena cerasifolii]|uniref:protein G12-like n=1 Tax=Andrena cerasifolii TaxID=2819439 RepID=UPI004037954D
MKLALAILAIVAVASGYKIPSTGSGALAKELQDFVDLIPLNEVKELVDAYLAEDKDFSLALDFIGSKESKAFIVDLEAIPEYKKLIAYMQNAGVDIYYLIQKVNEALGIKSVGPLNASDRKISGGLLGFAVDFADLVPLDKMTELLDEKMITSKVFIDYVTECLSPEYSDFLTGLTFNPHFLNLLTQVEQAGLDSTAFNQQYFILLAIKVVLAQ